MPDGPIKWCWWVNTCLSSRIHRVDYARQKNDPDSCPIQVRPYKTRIIPTESFRKVSAPTLRDLTELGPKRRENQCYFHERFRSFHRETPNDNTDPGKDGHHHDKHAPPPPNQD